MDLFSLIYTYSINVLDIINPHYLQDQIQDQISVILFVCSSFIHVNS